MNREHREPDRASQAFDAAPPEDILQRHLLRLWQGLLSLSSLGIDDDFFELGGSAAACDRMFAASEDIFDEPVQPADVSGRLSVRNLAAALLARLESRAVRATARRHRPRPLHYAAPQDILQDRLVDIWERLLGRTRVGIDDEFVALGGTNRLARRMFATIQELYGEHLDRAAFAKDGMTVRAMAALLVERTAATRLARLRSGGSGVPPLFFLHGDIGGGGYYVRELARGLGRDQSVFLMGLHGMLGDDVPPSIEAIAAEQIATIECACKTGPICVGGHCISAIVAFEMARQFVAQGREVACVLLVEPFFVHDSSGFWPLPPPRLSSEARLMPAVRVAWLLAQYLAILRKYEYGGYPGRVEVVWARDDPRPLDIPERRAFIKTLAPHVQFRTCPGTHVTAPGRFVMSLAEEMRASLSAAQVGRA